MSQGRYVWIAGKKVYLNPELQKEWDKLINKERYRARQEKICGQADYRRCNGDCFVCPWRKEGIVVSYETEHFAEGFGNDNAARGYGVVNCESTLEEKYIAEERYNTLCARIYRYADSAYPDGAKIIACYLNGKTLESTAKELHLTVRAVHYRLHQTLKYIREHRSTFCDFRCGIISGFDTPSAACSVAFHLLFVSVKIFFAEILEIA